MSDAVILLQQEAAFEWDWARFYRECCEPDIAGPNLLDADDQGLDTQALAGHSDPKMTRRYIRSRKVPLVKGPTPLYKKA
jgi:hypothetical protein